MALVRGVFLAVGMVGLLVGCAEEPETEPVERVRAIKPFFVTEPAGGDVRRYSGSIDAAETSALSFAVSGTVATVAVKQGDAVTQGQILASLDPTPLELDVQAAQCAQSGASAGSSGAISNAR